MQAIPSMRAADLDLRPGRLGAPDQGVHSRQVNADAGLEVN